MQATTSQQRREEVRSEEEVSNIHPQESSISIVQPPQDNEATAGYCSCQPINKSNALKWCHGRAIVGPDYNVMICSSLLILGPSLILCIYTSTHWIVSLIGGLLALASLYFLFQCGTTDPGYLPKAAVPPDHDPALPQNRNTTEKVTIPAGGKLLEITVERKWCYSCNILRPARASHCNWCKACVEKMDHHCPWTGTCVGRRNYRYFIGFIYFTALTALFVAVSSIYAMIWRKNQVPYGSSSKPFWEGAKKKNYFDLMLMLYALLFICMVGGLACYHTYLLVTNQTTHEEMKDVWGQKGSPYSMGCWHNVWEALFSPMGRSKIVAVAAAANVNHPTGQGEEDEEEGSSEEEMEEVRQRHLQQTTPSVLVAPTTLIPAFHVVSSQTLSATSTPAPPLANSTRDQGGSPRVSKGSHTPVHILLPTSASMGGEVEGNSPLNSQRTSSRRLSSIVQQQLHSGGGSMEFPAGSLDSLGSTDRDEKLIK